MDIITPTERAKYEAIFNSLVPVNGKLSGEKLRPVLLKSNLPQQQLAQIWEMSDLDKDGMLDFHEMCIAMHLVYKCIETHTLPDHLPPSLTMRRENSVGSAQGSRNNSIAYSPTSSRILPPPMTSNSRTSSVASLNRGDTHSVTSNHSDPSSAIPRPGFKSILDQVTVEFPVDRQHWDEEFNRLDTSRSGYLSGGDIRATLMASGLPQPMLAHIWSLVDIVKTGRLNNEQFALIMELVKEARLGVKMPDVLPAHLIPPSVRGSMPNMPFTPSEQQNPRLRELAAEIEQIIADRHKADNDVMQFESDITIKSSTVKNLEIELNTLVATVQQLKNQKGEASKRLGEMDERIEAFKATVEEGKNRLNSEEERLAIAKADVGKAKEAANAEEQVMYSLSEELRGLDNEVYQKKMEINRLTQSIARIGTEMGDMDQKIEKNQLETVKIEAKKAELEKAIKELESATSPTNDDPLLLQRFDELNLNGTAIGASVSNHSFTASFDNNFAASDPFKSSGDPFSDDGNNFDPFGSSKKQSTSGSGFGSFDKDPFAQADPFASSTTATSNNFADFSAFNN